MPVVTRETKVSRRVPEVKADAVSGIVGNKGPGASSSQEFRDGDTTVAYACHGASYFAQRVRSIISIC